jgi:hypothetical protein
LKDNKVELGQELVIDESTAGISDILTRVLINQNHTEDLSPISAAIPTVP